MSMPLNAQAAVREIDFILRRYEEAEARYQKIASATGADLLDSAPESVEAELTALLKAAIDRLAPTKGYGQIALETVPDRRVLGNKRIRTLAGVLQALRDDYLAGRVQTFAEGVRAELFSDFLEMGERLLEGEGRNDPATILVAGVLEQHLRRLHEKHGLSLPAKPKLDVMNAELARQGVYSLNEQERVEAWAALCNSATLKSEGDCTREQVRLMIAGVREFIARNPA